tara:strand:- start:117 stop:326 length:210 start_codon:yes stop_codon:yes gene_type:complete
MDDRKSKRLPLNLLTKNFSKKSNFTILQFRRTRFFNYKLFKGCDKKAARKKIIILHKYLLETNEQAADT